MVEPYAAGAPLRIVQTEQTNQSLLGVLARVTSDVTAIRARPDVFDTDVSIHVLALAPETLQLAFRTCALPLLAFAALCACVPRARRDSADTLGELALVVLLMLFLCERSWKQHCVTLCIPTTCLLWKLGERGGDYAEAWGAWFFGGLALFVACGLVVRRSQRLAG